MMKVLYGNTFPALENSNGLRNHLLELETQSVFLRACYWTNSSKNDSVVVNSSCRQFVALIRRYGRNIIEMFLTSRVIQKLDLVWSNYYIIVS